MQYIIRDHDRSAFEARKRFISRCADTMNTKYGEGTVTIELKDQYYNMKEKIDPQMHVIDVVVHAINFHCPYEFVSIQSMQKAMQVIVKICELTADYNN